MPELFRLICQASPWKTHQRRTLAPFALAPANVELNVSRLCLELAPPLSPPPKSRCQLNQGTLAPWRYHSPPCQGIREPAGRPRVVVWPAAGPGGAAARTVGAAGASATTTSRIKRSARAMMSLDLPAEDRCRRAPACTSSAQTAPAFNV